jgi:hypothetical protein
LGNAETARQAFNSHAPTCSTMGYLTTFNCGHTATQNQTTYHSGFISW